jgi:putative nucleotidyltransferase with HDIG domain
MEEKQVFKRLDSVSALSTLPEVLAEILRIADDERAPLDELAKVILKDVPLTARVLGAANSTAYGRNLQATSIRDAIMTLGARTVKSIVLSVSLIDLFNRLKTQIDLQAYWKHSLEVAILSEMLAEKINLGHKEEAYIAGLFHDIGILLMDSCFPREYAHVWQGAQNGESLMKLEESVFNTNHCQVGSYIISRWNLPQVYAHTIIEHHNTIELKEPAKEDIIPQIVNLAERLARYQFDHKPSIRDMEFNNGKIILKNLGLSNSDLVDIESEIVPKFLEAASYLDLEVGSPMELLSEANLRIFRLYREIDELLNSIKKEINFAEHMEYDRLAVEILHTVVATFSHYFNNACASMLGRAQLVEMALNKGELKDNKDILKNSLIAIQNGVNSITGTIQELKQVKSFKTTLYHDKTLIIDLEDSLKKFRPKPKPKKPAAQKTEV